MYAFVNEKKVNGKLYRAFRNTEDPKDCYVEVEGEKIKVENLKRFWEELNGK